MLERSFIHLPTVGPQRELAIWRAGIACWEDFLARGKQVLPPRVYGLGRPVVERSLAALASPQGLLQLASLFPAREHWRFYPRFSRAAFLDIETGGDLDDWGGVTVVGVYDGRRVRQYVAGRDLHEVDQALRGFDLVVTFSGTSFDLPVLRRVFGRLHLPPLEVDLRFLLRRLGFSGGLKRIEKMLGLERPPEVSDLGGRQAVELWQAHLAGQEGALETLLTYNACDVINLAPLLERAVAQMRQQCLGRLEG